METKDVNRLFIDTNILIYATNESSPWRHSAANALMELRRKGIELIVSPQIIREYLCVVTRSASCSKNILFSQILENLNRIQKEFVLVEENRHVVDCLVDIVRNVSVAGKQIHDANIVATMITHGVSHLLTRNTADFIRFSQYIHIAPLED
ncbi:MAG: type II toxin-antitoxin system VapC family toxin [Candidatus Omnitrophota bacterium]